MDQCPYEDEVGLAESYKRVVGLPPRATKALRLYISPTLSWVVISCRTYPTLWYYFW